MRRILTSMRTHALVLAGGSGDRFGARDSEAVRAAGRRADPAAQRARHRRRGRRPARRRRPPDWLEETRRDRRRRPPCRVPASVVAGRRDPEREHAASAWRRLDADRRTTSSSSTTRCGPSCRARSSCASIEPVCPAAPTATDTVIPSADTLVIVEGDDVIEIPERARYRRGQTPQMFRKRVLAQAYEAAAAAGDLTATDDCSLVLRHVPGRPDRGRRRRRGEPQDHDAHGPGARRPHDPDAHPRPDSRAASPRRSLEAPRLRRRRDRRHRAGDRRRRRRRPARGRGGRAPTGLDVRDCGGRRSPRRRGRRARSAGSTTSSAPPASCASGGHRRPSPEELAEIIDVNVTGTLNVARAAHPHLGQRAARSPSSPRARSRAAAPTTSPTRPARPPS